MKNDQQAIKFPHVKLPRHQQQHVKLEPGTVIWEGRYWLARFGEPVLSVVNNVINVLSGSLFNDLPPCREDDWNI